jgi:hypothetical protein
VIDSESKTVISNFTERILDVQRREPSTYATELDRCTGHLAAGVQSSV